MNITGGKLFLQKQERGPGDTPDVHRATENDSVVFWKARI